MKSHLTTSVFMIALVLARPVTAAANADMIVLGWLENIRPSANGWVMEAKIDTGADNSSINTSEWRIYQKDGQDWVEYTISDPYHGKHTLHSPLLRFTHIKKKTGGTLLRPVVEMGLCLAGQHIEAEVNLADRAHFKYPLLIGRSMLEGRFLVDSSSTFRTEPVCKTTTNQAIAGNDT